MHHISYITIIFDQVNLPGKSHMGGHLLRSIPFLMSGHKNFNFV